jgi:photosystem II stability/assembly factor-like uncharacterized protein
MRKTALALIAILVLASSETTLKGRGETTLKGRATMKGRATPQAAAPTIDAKTFAALRWRSIGPARGGRSIASTGVPGRPLEYYFGAVGGGLWKTIDGGVTWNPVTDGQLRSSSVGAVAVAESSPDVVYIGMGEACLRGNIMQGDGVYKSTDAGKTWTHVGLAATQIVSRVRVHPNNPDLVYVAAMGHPAASSDERGVFRSKDGGKTWQNVLFRDSKTGAIDLAIDRSNPSVLYAALWEAYRVSWQMSSGGPGSGLFKSTDGGDTWTELTRNPGLPSGVVGRIGVAVSPADSSRVYIIFENDEGGVFKSDDQGATWARMSDDRRLRQRAFYYSHIVADPKSRDTVYVLNTGFYKSTDAGKTYTQLRPPHGDNHDLWIDPNDPRRMINSNDGGGNVSTTGGETWTDQDFATAQFYHVATTKDFPYHVCGAQQDNSTACVSSQPRGGRESAMLYAVGGGESGYIAPHPTNPNVFYAGSQGALVTRFDRAAGHIRDIQPYPRFFSGEPASALPERWQWTFPIVISPHAPGMLYICSQHVWRTTNEGQSWERISPDLTRADPKTLGHSGGPITGDMNGPEIFATVFALAPSKLERDTIWAGSDDGLVHVTRDGGKTWQNVTPKDLPEFARVSIIDASVHRPGTAYFAAKRYLVDDRAPYVYRTHDYGRTWTRIVNGIRSDDYAHVVREDPVRAGLLYAGTEHGAYVSFDDGEQWQSLSLNLPDTQISDMVVQGHDLVVATHGRSFWILDDIAPLRQWARETTETALMLFKPSDAIRSAGPATIYYFMKEPAEKVTVEILDSRGEVVRSVTGVRKEEEKGLPEEPQPGGGGGFGPPQPRPSTLRQAQGRPEPSRGTTGSGRPELVEGRTPLTNAGLTKFMWDLRYRGHSTFPGMVLWSAASQGPLAVPGAYHVRVTVGGASQTQPLQIVRHPTYAHVTQADLEAQFTLAVQIRDRTSEANDAVVQIRDLRKQIGERIEKAGEARARLTPAADALTARLTAVEEELYQVRNRSGQDPLNFPIRLNNRLAALRRSVETGDNRPTDGAYQVFKELSADLDRHLAALNAVISTEVAAFNRQLTRVRLPPLTIAKKTTN